MDIHQLRAGVVRGLEKLRSLAVATSIRTLQCGIQSMSVMIEDVKCHEPQPPHGSVQAHWTGRREIEAYRMVTTYSIYPISEGNDNFERDRSACRPRLMHGYS